MCFQQIHRISLKKSLWSWPLEVANHGPTHGDNDMLGSVSAHDSAVLESMALANPAPASENDMILTVMKFFVQKEATWNSISWEHSFPD